MREAGYPQLHVFNWVYMYLFSMRYHLFYIVKESVPDQIYTENKCHKLYPVQSSCNLPLIIYIYNNSFNTVNTDEHWNTYINAFKVTFV